MAPAVTPFDCAVTVAWRTPLQSARRIAAARRARNGKRAACRFVKTVRVLFTQFLLEAWPARTATEMPLRERDSATDARVLFSQTRCKGRLHAMFNYISSHQRPDLYSVSSKTFHPTSPRLRVIR